MCWFGSGFYLSVTSSMRACALDPRMSKTYENYSSIESDCMGCSFEQTMAMLFIIYWAREASGAGTRRVIVFL